MSDTEPAQNAYCRYWVVDIFASSAINTNAKGQNPPPPKKNKMGVMAIPSRVNVITVMNWITIVALTAVNSRNVEPFFGSSREQIFEAD
jgi:hypothetical protein